jgi:hypothetical protein
MGCRIIVGREQGSDREVAVLFCSTTGIAFGPVFAEDSLNCNDPENEAERFIKWLEGHPMKTPRWSSTRPKDEYDTEETSDPRAYPVADLMDLYAKIPPRTRNTSTKGE